LLFGFLLIASFWSHVSFFLSPLCVLWTGSES
jgi:hypothetical protein